MPVYLLFPHQLFDQVADDAEKVYLVEERRFFTDFDFHKKKLVLHRASMKAFQEKMEERGVETEYLENHEPLEKVFDREEQIKLYDPVDHELEKRVEELSDRHETGVEMVETPMFLASMDWNRDYFRENDYYHLEYYKQQRKRLGVLVDEEGKPEGGKWSFDPENRKKLPEDVETPGIPKFDSPPIEEAKRYVRENFPENPGSVDDFFYPVTREQARENLEDFLEKRLENFGPYQDAIDRDLRFGFHSLLSSSLNTGLLTPREVVDTTLEHHEERGYPMNSLEGFIRQVIGWREYIRALYELEGEELRSRNFFRNDRSMPDAFYTGETGLPPVDDSIGNVKKRAYGHHIERLMVLSNIMLLLEIDPDEVYRWFTELFIDAYDWVMVPNVYGMGQYADPRIMTKPYISSSNYIRKMSHYPGGDWEDAWDGLYWSFIERHSEKLEDNRRMSMMLSTLERMDEETLEEHRENAEEFRRELF
ncbi:MAG: cryptochrome/photolyase family protein [Candidatus Nanohaloarchaea archaeon]